MVGVVALGVKERVYHMEKNGMWLMRTWKKKFGVRIVGLSLKTTLKYNIPIQIGSRRLCRE